MSRARKPRSFTRDDSLSIRLPREDKQRLIEAARKLRRDTSNLALEFICTGLTGLDQRMKGSEVRALTA